MFTDMVDYTGLGQKNEPLSLAMVDEQRKLIRPILAKHKGKEVKTMGDAFLVEFANALDAVRCAYDIQRASREYNISQPNEQRIRLRIGLHLGDVEESQGDILGDTVNVASRIQPLADDGGVCVTRQVYDQVRNKFELPMTNLGAKSLRHVDTPVEVYRMEMPWKTEAPTVAGELDTKRIAVLPFANMSPDPNDSFFADGITEEIISTLAGVGGLSVISRTSVMGYKGTTKNVRQIGHELDAGSVIEGSFRKAGNKIRVTAQLIAVDSDKHAWANSYDRELDDVFAVQTDIAKQVADALRVRILAPEIERMDKKPTESTKAYSLYLKGRFHWNKRGIQDIKTGGGYFEQAVKEDQNFALGYVGRADCYELLATNWRIDVESNHEKAKSTLNKALELDPELAEAHATLGLVLMHDFKFHEAELEFRKAVQLKPSYASAHQWYFHLLSAQLRLEEAKQQIEKAVQLDPFSQVINLNHAELYTNKKDYVTALKLAREAEELNPSFSEVHMIIAVSYAKLKMFEEAKRELNTCIKLMEGTFPGTELAARAFVARYVDEDKQAIRRLLPELEAHSEDGLIGTVGIAALYFYLGEIDRGFEWLERSYARKEFQLLGIRSDEDIDSVRDDPRYASLVKRLGLG